MNDFRCSQCKKLLAKIQPMISKDGTNYLTFHENGKVKDIMPKIEIICPRCKTMNIHKNEWFDENDKCTRCGKTVGLEFHFAHANNCRNTNPFGFVRLNEE